MQGESLRKSFHSLSFNFQKVFKFHSISHNQSHNNQTNKHKYLFNITFQNLEFWDVTLRILKYETIAWLVIGVVHDESILCNENEAWPNYMIF